MNTAHGTHSGSDLALLRDRLVELRRRHAEASTKLAALSGPREQLEAMRFELAQAAWRLDELESLAS